MHRPRPDPRDYDAYITGLAQVTEAMVVWATDDPPRPEQFYAWVIESENRPLFIRHADGRTFIIGLALPSPPESS